MNHIYTYIFPTGFVSVSLENLTNILSFLLLTHFLCISTSQTIRCMQITWENCSSAASGSVGAGLRFCISNNLPGNAYATGLQTTF